MSGVYSMTDGPTYTGATRQDLFDSAMAQPLSLFSTLGQSAKTGILESFGLGTAIKNITTPDEAPSGQRLKIATDAEGNGTGYQWETPEQLAKARADVGALSEDQYKASASYRDGIPYDPGMTADRAQALAAADDAKKAREYFTSKRPITAFIGNLGGQALDPINYIPIAGEALQAAAVARFGRIGGAALFSAVDAAANTAAFGLGTSQDRAKYGDDVSWAALTSQVAAAALIGSAFGALGGAIGKRVDARRLAEAERRMSTLRTVQESHIALNEGLDALANGNDIRLSPNSTEPMARVAGDIAAHDVPKVDGAIEPPVPDGFVRVYHSGSVGEGESGRWVSSNRQYAADYRGDLPLHYLDVPADDPRINNADIPEQGVKQGFTFNFETTPAEAAQLKQISRVQPPADLVALGPAPVKPKEATAKSSDSSLTRTASWVLRDKTTKKPVMETFDPSVVERLNTDKYEAVPIGQYLGEINGRAKPTPAIDTSVARPEPAPEGIKQAQAAIAKPDDSKALASQYRVDPQTGSFHEEAEVAQLAAEGRLTEHDVATLADAQAEYQTGSAFAEALKSVASCLL